jgi:hypothetical protein
MSSFFKGAIVGRSSSAGFKSGKRVKQPKRVTAFRRRGRSRQEDGGGNEQWVLDGKDLVMME